MTAHPSPRYVAYPRSAAEIATLLQTLLSRESFDTVQPDQLRDAIVRVAARYGEIVTASLNLAPENHLDELTALLAQRARPAAAARVHLSFRPTVSLSGDPVTVRAYTRVAGQAVGSGEPPIFETSSDISLVRVEPTLAVYLDAGHRWLRKLRVSELRPVPPVLPALVPYELHVGHSAAFGLTGLQQVKVHLGVRAPAIPTGQFDWIVRAPDGELPLRVTSDATGGLAQSGEIVLAPPTAWPVTKVGGIEARWLTLRFRTGAPGAAALRPPRLDAVTVRVLAAIAAQPIELAFHDAIPIDTSKDFLPFGDRPHFGSVFQLLCPSFRQPGAKIELQVQLTNPVGATGSPIPPVAREGRPSVLWEMSTASGVRTVPALDGTYGFTQSGSVSFVVPDDIAPMPVSGKRDIWLRARMIGGHYGTVAPSDGTPVPVMLAPVVQSMVVRATIERGPVLPEHLLSEGALTIQHLDPALAVPVDAVPIADVDCPALYIGLSPLGNLAGADLRHALATGQPLSWYVRPHLPVPPLVFRDAIQRAEAPRWQILSADGWRDMPARDGSEGLTQSGLVQVSVPEPPASWKGVTLDEPASRLAWLRIVWPATNEPPELPMALAINSVEARHLQRLLNEIVGSSAGRPDQVFRALRTPIIGPVRLQVRETEEDWVDWTEVESVQLAEHGVRAFALDRSTGEICFGDGRNGRIPPPGPNNIRLARYTIGGGSAGNQPAGALAQLRNAVPAIEEVTNIDPATGGLDADNALQVRMRGSVWLRHRGRAVGVDDFADLAKEASPEIARAYCVATRDLATATRDLAAGLEPGVVSVIVIPHGIDPMPQPRLDLLASVKTYLDVRRPAAARLVIVGPSYSRVTVRAEVAPADGWSPDEVAATCRDRICEFLHPVTGGTEQTGWPLGERPHRSDIYGLLDAMDCVDFIRSVSLAIDTPPAMPMIVAAGEIDVQPCNSP
jgi:hypothetical protein